MYELIITEKPSAAQKIAEALADGKPVKKSLAGVPYYELSHNKKDIVVVGAAGHLYGVAESGERTYDYPVLEMEWVPNADIEKAAAYTKKYINAIKKLAKNASEFTIATDYDIEGETIGLNIVRFICKQKDANRMKFSTLTKQDLVAAYEHKQKTLDWGQAHAGETRHFLDWLYGINLSRALTQSVKAAGNFKVLSIGRVQGPALRLIVEKEREIAAFTPEDYWQIELLSATTPPFSAWHASGRFTRETDAAAVHARCKGARTANVVTVDQRKQQQQPPHPFDLGTLQTEAFRCFRIKPKQTLEIAQSLYSGGFISYPRTSSQKLPPKLGYKKLLTALEKQERYAPLVRQLLTKPLKPNNGKKDDPAHPAIYPTGTVPGQLGEREHKIYDLIVKRFLATFGPPAQRAHLTLTLDANGEHFTAKGAHTTEPGWHAYYAPYVNVKEEELPPLAKQDSVPVKNIVLHKKQTQPPKRYTQSSIITELEKRGLGTKATRADVVEALFKRNYAKGDTAIEATQLGMRLLSTLEKHSPRIVDEALTRHFEEELEAIRGATKTGENVLTEAKNTLLPILEGFRKHERALGAELVLAHKEEREAQRLLGACPLCKDGAMYLMFSKKNKKRFAGCSNYPDCNNTYPLPQKGTISGAGASCAICGAPLVKIRNGRRTSTVCINPSCPGKNAEKQEAESKACSKCGKPMTVRKSVYGAFWGCSNYPKCKHTENIEKE